MCWWEISNSVLVARFGVKATSLCSDAVCVSRVLVEMRDKSASGSAFDKDWHPNAAVK